MASTKFVAYTDLGAGSGALVDPEEYGGVDSENFQYMLTHRAVVPISDPDAAVAMGKAAEVELPPDEVAELARLRARVAELEAEQAAAAPAAKKEAEKPPPSSGGGGGGSSPTPAAGGGGGASSSSKTTSGTSASTS